MEFLGCYKDAFYLCQNGLKTCQEIIGSDHFLCSKLKEFIVRMENRDGEIVQPKSRIEKILHNIYDEAKLTRQRASSFVHKNSISKRLITTLNKQITLPSIKTPSNNCYDHKLSELKKCNKKIPKIKIHKISNDNQSLNSNKRNVALPTYNTMVRQKLLLKNNKNETVNYRSKSVIRTKENLRKLNRKINFYDNNFSQEYKYRMQDNLHEQTCILNKEKTKNDLLKAQTIYLPIIKNIIRHYFKLLYISIRIIARR